MRIFAALPLPPQVSSAIATAFAEARALAPKTRWVDPRGMHLTLHFFGDLPDESVTGFASLFDDPGLRRPAITARLGHVGFFPASGAPRVLWVGLAKGVPEMTDFHRAFTAKLDQLRGPGGPLGGWTPDRRGFAPHVTVARSGSAPISPHWADVVKLPAEDFLVTECVLFQSVLGEGRARYVPLRTVAFQGGSA